MTIDYQARPATGDHGDIDTKVAGFTEHEEKIDPVDNGSVQVVSQYVGLGKLATVRRFWLVCLYCVLVAFAAIFDGYAVTIPGNIVANPGFVNVFATEVSKATGARIIAANHVGAWTGVQSAGQIIGMWSIPFISDRFGRKYGLYLILLSLTLAIILEIVAKEWTVFLAARLFAGLGTGLVQSGVTVYIGEVAPAQIRGSLLSMYSFFFGLGQFSAAIALKIVDGLGPSKFRNAFYSEILFVGLFLPMIVVLPESPWFYARTHKPEQAKKSMMRLYGNVPGYNVDIEYEVLRQNVAAFEKLREVQKSATIKELFTGVNGRRSFISFFPLAFQQFLGIPLVFQYSTYFFSLSGVDDAFLASLIINMILLTFIVVSFYTVERVGRRPSLLVGGLIMALCTLSIGIVGTINVEKNGTALVSLAAVWVAAYALSAGPLGWTFVGEASTPRLRAKTAGLAAGGTAVFGLVFNYTVPIMLDTNGANWNMKIGYLFSGLSFAALVVVYFTIPETRGRTYDELDELFQRKISARKFKETTTELDRIKADGRV